MARELQEKRRVRGFTGSRVQGEEKMGSRCPGFKGRNEGSEGSRVPGFKAFPINPRENPGQAPIGRDFRFATTGSPLRTDKSRTVRKAQGLRVRLTFFCGILFSFFPPIIDSGTHFARDRDSGLSPPNHVRDRSE